MIKMCRSITHYVEGDQAYLPVQMDGPSHTPDGVSRVGFKRVLITKPTEVRVWTDEQGLRQFEIIEHES